MRMPASPSTTISPGFLPRTAPKVDAAIYSASNR
jgi:hypothetical protein